MGDVCPANCEIIQDAIKIQERLGVTISAQVDYKKKHCAKCLCCLRNEFATMPMADMSDEKGSENNA